MVGIRFAFVHSVRVLGLPIAKACREYGISRTTGYSWLKRYDIGPERLMTDYSRRPHHIPTATPAIVAVQILALRDEFGWSARNIRPHIANPSGSVPSLITINRILRRSGRSRSIRPQALEFVAKLMVDRRLERDRKINESVRKDISSLLEFIAKGQSRERKRAAVILLLGLGEPKQRVVRILKSSRQSVGQYWREYREKGPAVVSNRNYGRPPRRNDKNIQNAIFKLLHSPPSSHGINRTTWRMTDLRMMLRKQGMPTSLTVIREVIRAAGYKWRRARVVLTSKDPNYHEKLDYIRSILSNLKSDERFFSIDEFGPFAIKMRPGRLLVSPNEYPTVPQYQKSKGYLIVTAALELSTNQVTHLYSRQKNTVELIRLMELLIQHYAHFRKLYFSWDSASWHGSKKLNRWLKKVNDSEFRARNKTPLIELAPLPTGAQFLNVIESVFSGLARAVIHNSDYPSVEHAMTAIDTHFHERNAYFQKNPKPAGNKIWGKERVPCRFSDTQNCKDPHYQ